MEKLGAYLESSPEINQEYAFASEIIKALHDAGHEAYIVGGFCRDLLCGEISKDIDIATSAKPEDIAALGLGGVTFIPVQASEAMPIVLSKKDGMAIETATFRKDIYEPGTPESRIPHELDLDASLLDDASRRDLTVNSLYLDPLTEQLIDPTEQGISDTENRTVRFIGEARQRILEDRVRILRAVRLKNKLGFNYAPETAMALAEQAGEVSQIRNKDRILVELQKMLAHPSRAEAIQDLDDLGILERLIPEFTAGKEVGQSPDHHTEGNVFKHQMLVLRNLPPDASDRLAMAAMLHDVGKRVTRKVDEEGNTHFYGHDQAGVEIARGVLSRLKMKNEDAHAVLWLIANHMNVWQFLDMRRSNQIRMVMPHVFDPKIKQENLFDELVNLLVADASSSIRPDGTTGLDLEMVAQIRQRAAELRQEFTEHNLTVREQFGLDGKALIELLHPVDGQEKYLSSLIAYLDGQYHNEPTITKEELEQRAQKWWDFTVKGISG